MGGAKTSFILGGRGLKPDTHYRQVSAGKFTKASRRMKPVASSKAINSDGITK